MPNKKMKTLTIGSETYDIEDSKVGDLADLETEDKSSIVAAINEIFESGGGTPATRYSVTNKLTNVSSSNSATSVKENSQYSAILSLAESATLNSVTVTMGGVDITSTAWDSTNMTVSIASVTGNVVITASAVIVISQTVTWSGSGADKTSQIIDATTHDLYWMLPFVEGASQISSGSTAESDFVRIRANLYSDAEATTLAGYYYIDDQEISQSNRTTLNTPTMPTNTSIMFAPHGYYVKMFAMKRGGFVDNANCATYLNTYANTITLVAPDSGGEDESISNAESVDRDLLQMYTKNVVPLETDTISETSTYAAVLEEAKNAWMAEYSGSINKIPLICHADQHDTMGDSTAKGMWETIDNMVSWYDVSKVINFGDTTNSYDNFDNPELGDSNLAAYLEATENIPFSKRIEIFGNHDCMKIINASLTYVPHEPSYLNPYFKNVMARRTSNNGYHVTYDPYFNVKYIVYSSYDYVDSTHYDIVSSEQYEWLIEEMTKNDGYDIIMCGHQDGSIYQEHVGTLITARYNKTSGTFTDKLGISHTYDFSSCENNLLVCLHGHSHDDSYNYDMGVLSQCFDNYYDSTRPIFFVIVDRENKQLKAWKVTNTPEYTTYTRPFVEAK